MTKSQNTKNEQQKDLCITSEQLTEQWKKGELPSRWYYIEVQTLIPASFGYYIEPAKYITSFDYPKSTIKSVLAPVPSYEEWETLKDLLKEIRGKIAESQLKLTPEGFKLITEIVQKIDEVLK